MGEENGIGSVGNTLLLNRANLDQKQSTANDAN